MTVQSAMLKQRGQTLMDYNHYLPNTYNYDRQQPMIRTKTYTVTTIIQQPYLMQKTKEYGRKEDQYEGFCKDLLDLVTNKLGIKYHFKLTKDPKRKSDTQSQSWSRVLDEIVRKEADIAVAPLAITTDRERIVDFTEPFLSVDIPVSHKKTPKQLSDTFSFLKPLSKEIWLCVLFSFFAVSIVLFLVSRFSPREWKSISISDSHLDHPITSTNEIILHNEFSIWNSFWFSLGSFMQQGSDVVPRSLSGRIVGTVWWFFALILVCSYTANLAAYLIVERIAEPAQSLIYMPSLLYTETVHELRNNLVRDSVLSEDKPTFTYVAGSESHIACDTTTNICRYKHLNFAIATPKGSILREAINLVIVNFKKDGTIAKLWNKWIMKTKKADCDISKDEETTITEMTLSQVAGIFYVLLGGLALALSVALVEFCQHGRAEAARANVPLRAALRARARLASAAAARDRKQPPQRTPQREHERLGWNGAAFAGYNDFLLGREMLENIHRKIY